MTADTTTTMTVGELSALDERAFVDAFAAVFEDHPDLAAAAFHRAPFTDLDDLVDAFHAAASDLDGDARLALLRAHPQLGARRPMADASIDEQRSAGLDRLERDPATRLAVANESYLQRHGFPFIIAVRGRSRAEILNELDRRSGRPTDEERDEAFQQVLTIAELRVRQLVIS